MLTNWEEYQHITHCTPQNETVRYSHQHSIIIQTSYSLLKSIRDISRIEL